MTDEEEAYYDSIIGPRKMLDPNARWVGVDKPKVEYKRQVNEPRDYGDNNPADPEQNWEIDRDKEEV